MSRLSDYKTYPEFVDPDDERGYNVIDISKVVRKNHATQGVTDKQARVMAIPLTPEGEYIGRHEMGHAKWSPVEKPHCNTELLKGCMEACEEMRVNTGLEWLGMPVVYPTDEVAIELDIMETELFNPALVMAMLRLVVPQGTNAGKVLRSRMRDLGVKGDDNAIWISGLMDKLDLRMKLGRLLRPVPSFNKLFKMAKWLEKQLREHVPSGDEPDSQAKEVMVSIHMSFGETVKMGGDDYSYKYKSGGSFGSGWWGGREGQNHYDPMQSPFYGMDWRSAPPGEMHVETPKLTINIIPPELEKTMRSRAAEEGTEFRYIERFVSDQRVFKRRAKKRKGGGSVLVDTSASMGLSDEAVASIVKGAPEATKIATYAGSGLEGWLRVVVDKGKMLDGQFNPDCGSNVIDLPALEWLSMQPEPRVWISDGVVTGINDEGNYAINKACNTVMGDNNIVRVETVEDACKALKRNDGVGFSKSCDDDSDDYDDDEDEDEEF